MILKIGALASALVLLYLYDFQCALSLQSEKSHIHFSEDEELVNYLVKKRLYRTGCNCGGACNITHPETGNRICICDPGTVFHVGYATNACYGSECKCGKGQITCSYHPRLLRNDCYCMIGYENEFGRCVMKFDVCYPNPCYNGGTCNIGLENYTCDCPETHTGPRCEIGIDPCEFIQCENNGTCPQTDAANYTCICPETYNGTYRNKVIQRKRPCDDNPCKNGGTCWERLNGHKRYMCTCPPTHSGYHCEEDLNACDLNPCQNGICWKGEGSRYLCICAHTHTGRNCETAINPCHTKPCFNGGICWTGKGLDYICICPRTYTGYNCKIAIRACDANPCRNGGICWNGNGTDYVCSCPNTHKGKNCETAINPCESAPCKNGGTCFKGKYLNYTCNCTANFKGRDCEIVNHDKCDPNPCQNDGNCSTLKHSNSYKCSCTKWYTGKNCTEDWWCSLGIGKYLCQKGNCSFDHANQIGFCNNYLETDERKLMLGSEVVSALAFDSADLGSGMDVY